MRHDVPAGHKFCPDCGAVKSRSDFYRNASRYDGLQVVCVPCSLTRANRWNSNNREKNRATSAVKQALMDGNITKQVCFCCGAPAEAHHPDYSRPLDAVWLCRSHHRALHKRHEAYLAGVAATAAIDAASESSREAITC